MPENTNAPEEKTAVEEDPKSISDETRKLIDNLTEQLKKNASDYLSLQPKIVEFITDPWYDVDEDVVDPFPRRGGCLTARLNPHDSKKIQIGYSFKHPYLDVYDKDFGFDKSFARMDYLENSSYKPRRIHPRYRPILMLFLMRCLLYFKGCDLPNWAKDFMKDEKEIENTREFVESEGTEYQEKKFLEMFGS